MSRTNEDELGNTSLGTTKISIIEKELLVEDKDTR